MVESVIEVGDLKKTYGKIEALKGINFEVKRKEVFTFIGPTSLLPPVIRKISTVLPSTYLVNVLRKSLIMGSSFGQIFPDLTALGIWILGTASLASFIFRWAEER